MDVLLQQFAREELFDAAEFYESRLPGLAMEFIHEFDKTLERIATHPLAGTAINATIRYQLFRRFPYTVFYSYTNESIIVLAVAHQHRRPGYWSNKVVR